jgi:gliding motility-associated-like protein
MPNSFTPNNDGVNDVFKPTVSQPLAAYRFTIYNRYGQTIFTTTQQYTGWNGMYQSSRQPMGGYIYTCTYRFNAGTEKTVTGYFMLLR